MFIDYEWKNIICSYYVLEGKKLRLGKKSYNLIVCIFILEEKSIGIKKLIKIKNCKIVFFFLDYF